LYSVELSQRAQKYLSKLDEHIRERIEERLRNLAGKPIPKDSKFICREGDDKVFRYRIGDFRALYKVKPKERVVLIAKIDKRPRVYHR